MRRRNFASILVSKQPFSVSIRFLRHSRQVPDTYIRKRRRPADECSSFKLHSPPPRSSDVQRGCPNPIHFSSRLPNAGAVNGSIACYTYCESIWESHETGKSYTNKAWWPGFEDATCVRGRQAGWAMPEGAGPRQGERPTAAQDDIGGGGGTARALHSDRTQLSATSPCAQCI